MDDLSTQAPEILQVKIELTLEVSVSCFSRDTL